MIKKWWQNYRARWAKVFENGRNEQRERYWKNCLRAALNHYNQLEQFDKSVRVAKRLGDGELIQLTVTCRFMKSLLDGDIVVRHVFPCPVPITDQAIDGQELTDIPGKGVQYCVISKKDYVEGLWWARAAWGDKSIHVYYCPTRDMWCAPEYAECHLTGGIKRVRLTY